MVEEGSGTRERNLNFRIQSTKIGKLKKFPIVFENNKILLIWI